MGLTVVIDKDVLEDPLVDAAFSLVGQAPGLRACAAYTSQLKNASYETVARAAAAVTAGGASAVVVAPYGAASRDASWQEELRQRWPGVHRLEVLYVTADINTLWTRMKARDALRDRELTWERLESEEGARMSPQGPHRAIDTSSCTVSGMSQIADRLIGELSL